MLIVFEGIEGSSKTTQAKMLHAQLESMGVPALYTKQPGSCFNGSLRSIILNNEDKPTPLAELFLYLADRAQHYNQVIRPALSSGKWVVLDRFMDSTMAYQGYLREVMPKDMLYTLNRMSCGFIEPNITFLLDLDPDIARTRIISRAESARLAEVESNQFQLDLRVAYLDLVTQYPTSKRYYIIDANKTPIVIHEDVLCGLKEAI